VEKPSKRTKEAYDWNEARTYIESVHDCDLRNFANKTYDGSDGDDRPYQDYWHYLIDVCYIIGNGCYFTMEDEMEGEPWQQEITGWIFDEFGEPDDFTGRSAVFWVEW